VIKMDKYKKSHRWTILLFMLLTAVALLVSSCTKADKPAENLPPVDDEPAPVDVRVVPEMPVGGQEIIETKPVDMKPAENPDLVVTIPDRNLEIVIRTEIGKPDGPITAGDMAQIIDLSAPNSGIQTLDSIEYCVNLLGLNMASGQEEDAVQNFISDLKPIAGLVSLERLSLQGNRINDLAPLKNLISLRAVNLSDNGLEDISTLGNLINLEDLLLINNKVGDISSLENCRVLKNLWVQHNEITDIGSLRGLENLEKVFIDSNLIRDLAPLVENPGIGDKDQVFVTLNPLTEDAVNIQLKVLRDRGVFVSYAE